MWYVALYVINNLSSVLGLDGGDGGGGAAICHEPQRPDLSGDVGEPPQTLVVHDGERPDAGRQHRRGRAVGEPRRLQRAGGRARGKSDPIDALAVARAVLRDPDLPVAAHDEVSRELKLLVDRREDLVVHRTSTINRFLSRVHELDPDHSPKKGSMDRAKTHKALAGWLSTREGIV